MVDSKKTFQEEEVNYDTWPQSTMPPQSESVMPYYDALPDDFSGGVSDPNLTNNTNRKDLLIRAKRRSETFEEFYNQSLFNSFPDNLLIINDVY